MDPQLLEYRQKQRECFLVKAEAPAPTKLVELLLAAEAAALPQTSFHGVDNATLDAVAKAMWEGSGEQSILNMLLPDSDDEDLVGLVVVFRSKRDIAAQAHVIQRIKEQPFDDSVEQISPIVNDCISFVGTDVTGANNKKIFGGFTASISRRQADLRFVGH